MHPSLLPALARRGADRAGDHGRRRAHRRLDHAARRRARRGARLRARRRARDRPARRLRHAQRAPRRASAARLLAAAVAGSARVRPAGRGRASPTPRRSPPADRVLDPAVPAAELERRGARAAPSHRRAARDRPGRARRARRRAAPVLAPGALAARGRAACYLGASAGHARAAPRPAARRPRDGRRGLPARPWRRRALEPRCPRRPAPPAYARVLRRTFEQGAFADRAFQRRRATSTPRDRALAHAPRLRRRPARADARPPDRAAAGPRRCARSTRRCARRCASAATSCASPAAPPHAAVNDAVELAKRARAATRSSTPCCGGSRASATELLGDARATRIPPPRRSPLDAAAGSSSAGGRRSAPERARALLARANEPAENALRANTLRTDARRRSRPRCGDRGATVPGDPPEAVIALEPFDAHGSPLWRAGALMPQSRASMLVAHALDPQPGERVLDLCAAPGRQDHAPRGADGRARRDRRGRAPRRPRARAARAPRADGRRQRHGRDRRRRRAPRPRGERFDARAARRALLGPRDAAVAPRPALARDARSASRRSPSEQARLLSAAAAACAPGGTLVYSTCTISTAENERQIGAFLDAHPAVRSDRPAVALPGVGAPGRARPAARARRTCRAATASSSPRWRVSGTDR